MTSKASPQQPDLPWSTRIFLSAVTFATDLGRRPNFTVNRRLTNFLDTKCPPSAKPDSKGVKSFDLVVDASRGLWFRLFAPAVPAGNSGFSFPVIVYFHGGGFFFLGANSKPFDGFCRQLASELTAVVISVNYRLSPEHKFPCQYDDGFDVLKFIDNNPDFSGLAGSDLQVNLRQCFLAGDSAGGNLAHHVAVRAGKYKFQSLDLIGLISMQPYFGGEERTPSELKLTRAPLISVKRTDWAWKAFLPEGSDRDHPSVNVFGPNAGDISKVRYPATVVFVGGFDPLQDWQKRYCEGLKKSGKQVRLVEYPNAIHAFYSVPELPEYSMFLKDVGDFMKEQMATSHSIP